MGDEIPTLEAVDQYAIVASGLTKRFGDVTAVDGVDLSVRRGEFYGFLGPNGAGKTTMIKMLCGLIRPTSGLARVAGFDVLHQSVELKAKIGVLPEIIHTFERLTGWELVIFSGMMYGVERAEARRRAEVLLELVDLVTEDREKLVVDYSMGMKKKVALACALIHGPEVIFLDEPFNGIDALTTTAIQRTLQSLVARGVTIFYTSHVLDVVQKLCTRVAIINQGKICVQGTLAELGEKAGIPGATLEEIFEKLLGKGGSRGELDWVGTK